MVISTGSFRDYKQVQDESLKGRFLSTMINDVKVRHNIEGKGYETHPTITPYDNLMLTLMKDIKKQEDKINFDIEKENIKQSSMLYHEDSICPVINMTNPSKKVVDENGDVVPTPKCRLELMRVKGKTKR